MLLRSIIRTGILVLCVTVILWIVETAVVVAGTHHGWSLAPAEVSKRDAAWWQHHRGGFPPETEELIPPPPAVGGRPGAWYYGGGGHGGDGPPLNWSPDDPTQRFVAYRIEPEPLIAGLAPLIRGRVLSASSGEYGARVGIALPFVMHERYYFGPLRTQMPNPLEDAWQSRLVLSGMILNILIVTVVLGSPFYVRDIRAVVLRHRRCLHCGYDLRGHTHARCPECGAG